MEKYKDSDVELMSILPVSYTHLDVYKRQAAGYESYGAGE